MARFQSRELLLVNAFTHPDGTGGNAAAIVLEADDLSDGDKLAVAAAAGLSETAFVSDSAVASIKLEFFTPRRRIAHCGHATIATFGFFGSTGRLSAGAHTKETMDGLREVTVAGAYASMEQTPPKFLAVDQERVLAALGLAPADLDPRFPPERVDTGNGFIVVGVKDTDLLESLDVDAKTIEEVSELYDIVGFYVFTTATADPEVAATSRMFAPRYGIDEEAATGMAAGPLACLLYREGAAPEQMTIEQGRFMTPPSPSRIDASLTVRDGAIIKLGVGGLANVTGSTKVRFKST
ncbi:MULTISPECIES: PhzF family phenazine biosynthesis protein [unclassified Brevundimonas]|uniref:PhzF family phenazine biosynthesis protein n=1 Tax=unclassified Brevundimonas TaxID=2622653 RepID=UPI0025C548C7|nr:MULTISPECIES: PhzF family phenazine biosynthesis protein [unclassified Brevundimonas]